MSQPLPQQPKKLKSFLVGAFIGWFLGGSRIVLHIVYLTIIAAILAFGHFNILHIRH